MVSDIDIPRGCFAKRDTLCKTPGAWPGGVAYLLDLIRGQSSAITPATSTPSARMDIILLVKSMATTRNNKTPAATQRSFPIKGTDPEEAAALGRFFSTASLLLHRYHRYRRHRDTGKEHQQHRLFQQHQLVRAEPER